MRSSVTPLRVGLLGLGTVGYGVYRKLQQQSERFSVIAIAIRDLNKHKHHAPAHLLTTSCEAAVRDADIIVELIGGLEPAGTIVARALAEGIPVITANKHMLADSVLSKRLVCENLYFSAAIGGEVPMLETVRSCTHRGTVRRIEGVLNGTTNFILDQIAEGLSFRDALSEAQQRGFAEADPSLDLDGSDAACKLKLLVHQAFDVDLPLTDIERQGLLGLDEEWVRHTARSGRRVRLVAEAERCGAQIAARVALKTVDCADVFACIRNEENALRIQGDFATVTLTGKGAGRWPTTVSVMSDLWEVERFIASQTRARMALGGAA